MKKAKEKTKYSCKDCPAICCRNLAMDIGKPENQAEVEDLKWQLHFDTVQVYIRNRRWYQLVEGRCMYLNSKDKCDIYSDRPLKCRQHNPPGCERFGKFYDVMLSVPEDLVDYLSKSRSGRKILRG